MNKRNLANYSTKELFRDIWDAICEFEKKFFYTFINLFIKPEYVIYGYIGEQREKFFSVFKYLLISFFVSYMIYKFLVPYGVDSSFYESLKAIITERLDPSDLKSFSMKDFDEIYSRYLHYIDVFYQFLLALSLVSTFVILSIFYRSLKLNFASKVVAACFSTSQMTLISAFFLPFLFPFINVHNIYFINIFQMIYLCYFFYRLDCGKKIKKFCRALIASFFAYLGFLILNFSSSLIFSYLIRGQFSLV